MGLSILADEDVQRVVVTALRENGYNVTRAVDRYGPSTVDCDLLEEATERSEVILTEDKDFAALATDHDHGGILLIASHNPDPGDIVRAVDRLQNVHDPDDLVGEVIWIENWA